MSNPESFLWQEDRYREILRTPRKVDLLVKIWREAFGDEYPEEADPFGFVSISDLNRFAEELKLQPSAKLLDVGCGRGGPGLWVASKTGASLIGIDILPEAIAQAKTLRDKLGLTHNAEFSAGTFVETGLPSASVQGIMSVDSFWMVLDKTSALQELARVLEPGSRLVITTWVPPYLMFEPMLSAAGFRLLAIEETEGWKERQMAVYSGILKNRRELILALGERAAQVLIAEAEQVPERLSTSPRCLIVAERLDQIQN